MIKDKIIAGIAVGILADVVKLAFNYLAFSLKFTNVVFWQITATPFLAKKDLFTPLTYFIGGTVDLIVTAILGVIFVYFIYYTASDYLWIKGIGFGLITWVGLFGTFLGRIAFDKLPQSPMGVVVTLIAHLFFGLGLALFTHLIVDSEALKS
ncbi:MAG: hypothetical protein NUK65_05650 [Firmicutes bacterium]|nr:hypothetical protein [Bacillota bacterium]